MGLQRRSWLTGRSAVGNVVIAVAVSLNGTLGARHHVPFSVASRASMGFCFSYFAVVEIDAWVALLGMLPSTQEAYSLLEKQALSAREIFS